MSLPSDRASGLAAALLVVCSLSPAIALAQSAESTAIEEIQVTATRRPTGVREVPAALTLVSSERVRSAKLVTDALAFRTGVYLQQTTPGQGAAIIRGLKGSEILHVVDGLRMNNAIFRNAPTQYLALIAPGTIDRIEVLRGAPASLYGSDAIGGVVHVLSRMPEFDGSDTELRRTLSAGLDTAEIARSMSASLEAGNRNRAGLVSVDYLRTGNRRTGGAGRIGPTGYESVGARAAYAATPPVGGSWLLDFQYVRQPDTPRIDELVPGFGQSEPSSSEFRFAPNERAFTHFRYARLDGPLTADWNFDIGWQRVVDGIITRDFGSTIRRIEFNRSDLFGITLGASRELERGSWFIGGELYHDRVTSRRFELDLTSGATVAVAPRFPDDSSIGQGAVYANLLYSLSDRQRLSGGARATAVDIDLPANSLSVSDISADVGWLFEMTPRLQMVANLAHGFRAPNIFDIGTFGERPGNRFNIPNPALDSEHVTQFDVGIRGQWEQGQGELVVYRLHYRDRITSVLTGDVTPEGRDVVQSRNLARADIWGIEAAAVLTLGDKLELDALLNYTRGEEKDGGGPAVPADRIPPLNGRLGLLYEHGETLTVEPYLAFAGSQRRLSPRDRRDVRIDPNGTPGWLAVNLAITWQPQDRWRMTATLENLFDTAYRHHGSGIDAPGRNLVLRFDASW